MKINDIYKKYNVPLNLQRHMLLVSALADYIIGDGDIFDKKSVVSALLLHDIANLIKFNLNLGINLFDKQERDLNKWVRVQNNMTNRYGSDERVATLLILDELKISDRINRLIKLINTDNLTCVLNEDDYESKICVYCDFRAGQSGYISIERRFEEIIKRYDGRAGFIGKDKVIRKRDNIIQLENQIENKFGLFLNKLNLVKIEKIQIGLNNFEILGI